MPATEQTWRDLKVVHLVFGLSALAMLATTIWMVAADHDREWRTVQNDFQKLDDWTTAAQISEATTPNYVAERKRLQSLLDALELAPPAEALVDRFAVEVLYDRYLSGLSSAGKTSPAAPDPLAARVAALRAVPLKELDTAANGKLASEVLAELRQKVHDDTGLTEAYAGLLKSMPAGGSGAAGKVDAAQRMKATEAREAFLGRMRALITKAKFVEDLAADARKRMRSRMDAVHSQLDVGIRDGVPQAKLAEIQQRLDEVTQQVLDLTRQYDAAEKKRGGLEQILKEITGPVDRARKNVSDFQLKLDKLKGMLAEHEGFSNTFWQTVLQLPFVDPFNPRRKPAQIWLPKLTLNNNFVDVARFDRCTTCHQGIDKTAPGSAVAPAYPRQDGLHDPPRVVELSTPSAQPASQLDEEGHESAQTTEAIYGLRLAAAGALRPNDVTIEAVWPRTPAAMAGLMRGDVVTRIGDAQIDRRDKALRYLVEQVSWGQPLTLTIRRGVPQPFASHPRLDLFMGSLSPHKLQQMGCTICHQGQGSATSFKWASHTPNSLKQEDDWIREHGYFDNHHWPLPMYPRRFVESGCLKCHHQVVDLEPSARFPDPPAPKVVAGYKLIAKFGCYGCHEITGFDGPRRIGPDLRNEPVYYAAAAELSTELPARMELFEKMRPTAAAALKQAKIQQQAAAASVEQLKAQRPPDAGKIKAAEEALPVATEAVRAASLLVEAAEHSLADLADIGWLAGVVARHPEDATSRLRLLEYLTVDAGRITAADKLLADPGLTTDMFLLAQDVQAQPDDLALRDRLVQLLSADQRGGSPQLRKETYDLAPLLGRLPELSASMQKLGDQLKTVESPGTLRKVGPSLRHVASKLGHDTMFHWISNPRSIRDSTKMPRFFGLMKNLTPDAAETAARFEPIEARGAAQYLVDHSQPYPYATPPTGTETPSAERGKLMFQTRGCLACHRQAETPAGTQTFAPDLTGLGKKLRTEKGKRWLYSWLREPNRYHLRTVMPNTFLDLLPMTDAQGKPLKTDEGRPRMTDPAADIALYLLGKDWKPIADDFVPLSEPQRQNLDDLVLEYLKSAFPESLAKDYVRSGIPADVAPSLKGPEIELVGAGENDPRKMQQQKLNYIGRRAISKFGCSGCHDIPGFESARPIGTTLADWGRKETSKLAFEHILEYLPKEQAKRVARERAERDRAQSGATGAAAGPAGTAAGSRPAEPQPAVAHESLNPEDWGPDGFFIAALMNEEREGFLWQKLREPRSYDFKKTENKKYTDWLRMPQFNLTSDEREQVMTFVLGLVSEPPAAPYVYQPAPRQDAIIEGEKVLAKFNCEGCHMLQTPQWKIEFAAGDVRPPAASSLPPYLIPHFKPEEVRSSKDTDRRGLLSGTVNGLFKVTAKGEPKISVYVETDEKTHQHEFMDLSDLEGQPIDPAAPRAVGVDLWQPTLLDGAAFNATDPLGKDLSTKRLPHTPGIVQPGWRRGDDVIPPIRGGAFARLPLPIAIATQKQGEGADAWAWVPPPLVGEGRKTQSDWLHDFLLDPYPIRPGVILRMPKFNMSSDDATALVHYFAARDNAEYPHQVQEQRRTDHLEAAEAAYQDNLARLGKTGTRFGDAEKIVLSVCTNCHIVGDFKPQQNDRAKGPDLANVYRRLQGDYVRRWIADPALILPYTKMQMTFPYHPLPEDQSKDGYHEKLPGATAETQPYHGNSLEQIDAVTDLLMNWDRYMENQTLIGRKVKPAAAGPPPAAAGPPPAAAGPPPGTAARP